jgi:hypothetical protein
LRKTSGWEAEDFGAGDGVVWAGIRPADAVKKLGLKKGLGERWSLKIGSGEGLGRGEGMILCFCGILT